MRGVILDLASLDRGDLELGALLELLPQWGVFDRTPPERLDDHLAGAAVALTNKVVIDRATIQRHPELRLICVLATGMNNIDLDAAAERGITVKNVSGYGTPSVSQHVFMLILMLARQQQRYRRAVERGDWSRSDQFCLLDYPIEDLTGKALGIIGHGELGRAVARLGEAFGMTPLIAERKGRQPRPGRLPFERVVAEADVLSLHCPLTPETAGLIDAAVLAAMKPTAWLINTARGGLIDEAALAAALNGGDIAGAALDVLSKEPPPPDHPLLTPRDNLIVTPHIAWAARSARQRIIDLTADNIRSFLAES